MSARYQPSSGLLLVHYWLPVALGWSLAMAVAESSHLPFSLSGMTLLLAGIGTAYSLDRLHPAPRPGLRGVLLAASAGCGLLTLAAALRTPGVTLGTVALLGAASLFYPLLKRLPFCKTLVVTGAWLWACAWFPFAGEAPSSWHWLTLDVTLPLALLLAAACILCDIQDRADDRRSHIPSLPVLWGTRATCHVATLLALAGAALALPPGRYGLVAAGAALAFLARYPGLLRRKALGPLAVDATLLLPGVIILLRHWIWI